MRYRSIDFVHIGVKILYDHGGTIDQDVTKWLPTPTMNDNGQANVRKVWQNDVAFQMNASSTKVLWKVLLGFIIMEPYKRRCRVKGRRCPKTHRVLGQSGLSFRCHDATNRKKERGRKRDMQKSTNTINININKNEGMYVWKCMSMWHVNLNTSWAQPNPNLRAHKLFNIYSTYLKCMKI